MTGGVKISGPFMLLFVGLGTSLSQIPVEAVLQNGAAVSERYSRSGSFVFAYHAALK
jgi:hypothetical protein